MRKRYAVLTFGAKKIYEVPAESAQDVFVLATFDASCGLYFFYASDNDYSIITEVQKEALASTTLFINDGAKA